MDFTLYNTSTGEIVGHFTGFTESERSEIVGSDQSYILGAYPVGEFSHVRDGVAVPRVTVIDHAANNTATRNALLAESDWTQMPDSPLSDADKTAWQTYRQALRDLPTHANWPELQPSDWPNQPA